MKGNSILFYFLLINISSFSQRTNTGNPKNPDAEVQALAAEQYSHFLKTHVVIDSAGAPTETEMVKKVSKRVTAAVTTYYTQKKMLSELTGYNWETNLVDKKEVSAWCMPGGKIVVYTGLLEFAQNEGSLAVIIGHGIAHNLLRHGNDRLKQMLKEYLGSKSLADGLKSKPADAKDVFLMAYGIGTGMGKTIGVMPPFSLKDELEADKLTLIFSAIAGYNPREALVMWQRMARLSKSARQPEFLSTHPMDAEDKRMDEMEGILDEITKEFYKPANKSPYEMGHKP
jgi:predicted Zn-dependent protease